ncbi:hypothetical protein J6590_034869 [Homalodisca vitripennis]|nr:hypothetical protein J6590_034869 [Homalodisca vitripennis]
MWLWKEYSQVQRFEMLITHSSHSALSSMSEEVRTNHRKRVYCVRSLPEDFNIFVSGGWDCVVKIWDTRVPGGCVRDIDGPYIFGEAIDICQGKLLTASCQASNTLALWDIGSGKLITNIVPSNKSVYLYGEYPYTAQFYRGDPTGDMILCGGSGLGGLQVISIRRETIIYILEDEKPVVTVDSTDTNIAFGGKSNTVFFGNLYAQDESSQYVIRASSRETTMSSLMEMEMDME